MQHGTFWQQQSTEIMWVNVKNVHSAENFTQNLNNSSYLTWMRVQRRCAQDTVQVKLSKVCGVSLFQGFILRIGLNSECILNLCFFLILSWNNTKALYGHTLQTFWLYLWHLGEFFLATVITGATKALFYCFQTIIIVILYFLNHGYCMY